MNQKVLVADDSIASQRLFEMVLTREGYDVITLGSGAQALDMIREKHPDIALIDSIMPDADGYQICKALKEQADFRSLPVIMLAGRYEDFDREKGMNIVGPEAILNKPSKFEDIVAKVKEFLAAGEEEMEEMTVAEEVTAPIAEVIEEPAFVQEEYEFDEDSEEADLVVENELLEEGAEIVEIEEMEEEVQEVEKDEEGFVIEETEEVFEEPAAPVVATAVPTETPVAPEVASTIPEISPIPDEKLDSLAEEIAQRLTQKLVPALMQQIAVYLMQFPAVNTVVEETSKQLVKELLPQIQQKK